jgi:hypothetical protein
VGEMVLLSTRNIAAIVDKRRPTQKLTPKYIGPFKIIQVVSTTSYKLELPEMMKIHSVFHVSLLKPYKTSDDFTRPILPPPIAIEDTNEKEYEVEAILDMKIV